MNACTRGYRRSVGAAIARISLCLMAAVLALMMPGGLALGQGSGGLGLAIPNPDFPLSAPAPAAPQASTTFSVTAKAINPPTSTGYPTYTASWSWSKSPVQFSTQQGGPWADPPAGASSSVALGTSTDAYDNSSAPLTGSFGTAGYWMVAVTSTVTYKGSDGSIMTASGTTQVVFPVYTVTFSPASVFVLVGTTANDTATVVPADMAPQVSYAIADTSVATVTASPGSGGATTLTVSGVAAGTTQLQASLAGSVVASANVTVGTFSLAAKSAAICAGGQPTPVHLTLLTTNLTDINGNPLANQPITFATTDGTLSSMQATTDGNGQATTTLTSSTKASDPNSNPPFVYQAVVTAVGPGGSATAKVEFQPPQYALTASPNPILPTETTTLTLQATWNGQPVPQHQLTPWTISAIWDENGNQVYSGQGPAPAGYGAIQNPSTQTDVNGQATAQLVLNQARVAGDSPMSIVVKHYSTSVCGVLKTTGIAHLKRASEIPVRFPMSAAAQDVCRASHKVRLFKG